MNPRPKKITEIPGPKSRSLCSEEAKHLAPGLQGFALMAGVAMKKGQGSYLIDVDGNEYIDFIGGIGVNGLGHSHPRFVKALQAQLENLSVGSFTSEARVGLLQKISKIAPKGVDRLQLYSSGAEAVESAMRLAKCYTGKWEFISFWGGFHGKTLGVMGLLGDTQKKSYGPFAAGMHQVPYPDCYRCPFDKKPDNCAMVCVDFFRKYARTATAGAVAAVIVEPMQGTAGNIIPPKGWLAAVREVCNEIGALLICDEMITGFGRTGSWFASIAQGVIADIITLGKSFGGGFPVSGILSTDEITQAKPWSNPSGSSSSYGGNALAARAALTAIEIIEEEKLCENSRAMGERLLLHFKKMQEKYPFIGEVRGQGLFLGLEMVRDRVSKEPISEQRMKKVYLDGVRRGFLAMSYKASIRIQPALTINAVAIDAGAAILDDIFFEMHRANDWQ